MNRLPEPRDARRRGRVVGTIAGVIVCLLAYFGSFGFYYAHTFFGRAQLASKPLNAIFRPAEILSGESRLYFNYLDWCCSFYPQYDRSLVDYVRKDLFP